MGPTRTSLPQSTLLLTLVLSLLSSASAYFVITRPSASGSWANGSPYPLSWSKGLNDGITVFDIELTRLNTQGLFYVAKNVPGTYSVLNVLLEDVPTGDDYFAIFYNSTDGVIHSVSSRFSVTNSSMSKDNPSPAKSIPTATVSGTPDPLKQFATTLGPAPNGASSLFFGPQNVGALGFGSVMVLCAAFLGGAMTLW